MFEQVFPQFAAGFIEPLKGQVGMAGPRQASLLPVSEQLALKREPDEAFRRQVFNGTLTLLYRLLFLLYAESRDLLPVKEVRGYWERSLTKLKADIAEKAGPIGDAVPDQLRKAYRASADATELYDRLLDLFSVIDRGSRDLNVPLYNGGLFITNPNSADYTQEAETARFLASHKMPDRYLALGLDLLARDLDDKRQDLVFIDYKSLGVRQLGSIYEGLLEFKVRIAQEKMAVVKGKKTEEVIPYQEAGKSKKRVLTLGRGRNALERLYQPGEVYLENDRRERKASGSYYTPDHVVKYIVENTVGPALAESFDKLRPKFREAQQAYRKVVTRAESFRKQGMQPDDPAKVANTYAGLVDDLFDLKVLDPAMGSGHFLVEVVDFICDRILGEREGFLRAFPWNPVTKFLQDTRDAIVTEMERQGVAVDTGRLTDINLLKRHVLKRCAYGVDLNPMAVELAKVSLWLDCFTIGAPLSFLDHHLKCGNSLIGTTVQEIEAELAKQSKGYTGTLFGGPFQGLLAGTSTMLDIARSPDATVEQAERSHTLYAKFEETQAPYKAALDIWVSQHFGNARATEYLTLTSGDLMRQITSDEQDMPAQAQEVIALGNTIGAEMHFFHWDLEFPEAFVDLGHSTWRPKDAQGFDAVVGNPPWLSYSGRQRVNIAQAVLRYFKHTYTSGSDGWLSTHGLFLERNVNLLQETGYLGLIVPAQVADLEGYANIREYIFGKGVVQEPCLYHGEGAFEGVTEPSITLIVKRRERPFHGLPTMMQWALSTEGSNSISAPMSSLLMGLFDYLQNLPTFDKNVFGDPGVHTGNASKELITTNPGSSNVPIREGRDISSYYLRTPRLFLRLDVQQKDGKYFRIGSLDRYMQCPIVLRQTASRPIAAFHVAPTYFRNSVLACYGAPGLPDGTLVALLNSDLFAWFHIRSNRDAQQRTFSPSQDKPLTPTA